MRSFSAFSDYDFELFVADLLRTSQRRRYETFSRGPDGGIDLRRIDRKGSVHVVQCKRYVKTSFSGLLSSARAERRALERLDPQPSTYRFVTSKELTAANKRALARALAPYIKREDHVLGAHDLEALLDRYPAVERRHVKLWLTGSTQLAAILHSGTHSRSHALAQEIEAALPLYVQSAAFARARSRLRATRVCVIAGQPGIGKTTLARLLLADAVLDGYEPVEISHDVEEAWALLDSDLRQVFLYDDFLGRTALHDRFAKNEDRRLVDFMHRVSDSSRTLFVLTTREYILRDATRLYERLARDGIDKKRFLLELKNYSRLERARILYNHLFFSPSVNRNGLQSLLREQGYLSIIDHPNYNPRLIEWITGMAGHHLSDDDNAQLLEFSLRTLASPRTLWRHAFENELDDHARAALFCLATLPGDLPVDDLESAFDSICSVRGLTLKGMAFRRTLAMLDDSMIRTNHGSRGIQVSPHSPSVVDFVRAYLVESPADASSLLDGAVAWEQIEAMWGLLSADADMVRRHASRFAEAVQRCYAAPGLVRHVIPMTRWSQQILPAGTIDSAARLELIQSMRAADRTLTDELATLWNQGIEQAREEWRRGSGLRPSVLSLIKSMGEDPPDYALIDDARSLMQTELRTSASWEWLREFDREFPDLWSLEERANLTDEFLDWARNELAATEENMQETADLWHLERLADDFGVVLDEGEVDAAEQTLRRIEEERERDDPDPDEWAPEPARANLELEHERIETLFAHFK